jgi:hypothetical protein
MKQPIVAAIPCVLCLSLLFGGCATQPAPGISGRWKPVNRYAEIPQEIPLYQSYVFYPSPLDRTLKAMLGRWALDSGMTLVYQHPSDFTLYEPVASIHTGDLRQALVMLTSLYAGQHVFAVVDGNTIVVRQADPAVPGPSLSKP